MGGEEGRREFQPATQTPQKQKAVEIREAKRWIFKVELRYHFFSSFINFFFFLQTRVHNSKLVKFPVLLPM